MQIPRPGPSGSLAELVGDRSIESIRERATQRAKTRERFPDPWFAGTLLEGSQPPWLAVARTANDRYRSPLAVFRTELRFSLLRELFLQERVAIQPGSALRAEGQLRWLNRLSSQVPLTRNGDKEKMR